MVGRPILRAEESISETIELKDIMCGDEAAAVRQTLEIKYPVSSGLFILLFTSYVLSQVENGIVRSWEDMEHLWNYTFYDKMRVSNLC